MNDLISSISFKVMGQTSASTFKSGFITCEICGATKFYKYTQRRFGVYRYVLLTILSSMTAILKQMFGFSCVGCAKFYSKYLLKPVTYMCENLGINPIDICFYYLILCLK